MRLRQAIKILKRARPWRRIKAAIATEGRHPRSMQSVRYVRGLKKTYDKFCRSAPPGVFIPWSYM